MAVHKLEVRLLQGEGMKAAGSCFLIVAGLGVIEKQARGTVFDLQFDFRG